MRRPLLCLLFVISLAAAGSAAPVEFVFRPAERGDEAFARELWAEVHTPAGTTIVLPAYYRGNGEWAVRARRSVAGTYRLGAVTESAVSERTEVAAAVVGPAEIEIGEPETLLQIGIDPRRPRLFVDARGDLHYPIGANFAWARGDPDRYYPPTLAAARGAGMNWARVWMAHWGRLNLDWVIPQHGQSPPPGELDATVAARWDRLIAAAEANEVRLQIVLQHHGQYSSNVNSNWDINPWNRANGGFLDSPRDFFTSPEARAYSKQKYRYIVARWGYSPAVFAWELFNEVKWTDARAGDAKDNAAVAAWHDEMARHLRACDAYGHLVTTSDDSLGHALYASMDYFQPHLYANNMLAAVRRFDIDPTRLDRPIFYGEVGDDNMDAVPPKLRSDGRTDIAIAWASLMGDSPYPGQLWYVQRLLDEKRLGEFAALAAFVRASQLDRRPDLVAFSPAAESAQTTPFIVPAGAHWHRQSPPTVHVPFDGSVPAELAKTPRALVGQGSARREIEPFPHRVTLLLDYPAPAEAVLRLRHASPGGASVHVTLDGKTIAEKRWPASPRAPRNAKPQDGVSYRLHMPAGARTLVIENPHGPEWVEFGHLETGLDVPALAAVGKRAADRVVLWVYHREGIFSTKEPTAASATLLLPEIAAGRWRVTWWDVRAGGVRATELIEHAGGTLRLPTPRISRHGAVWLERAEQK